MNKDEMIVELKKIAEEFWKMDDEEYPFFHNNFESFGRLMALADTETVNIHRDLLSILYNANEELDCQEVYTDLINSCLDNALVYLNIVGIAAKARESEKRLIGLSRIDNDDEKYQYKKTTKRKALAKKIEKINRKLTNA